MRRIDQIDVPRGACTDSLTPEVLIRMSLIIAARTDHKEVQGSQH